MRAAKFDADLARLRNPMATARNLGSAKSGTEHWWMERITSLVLALLTPWFLWLVIALIGLDQVQARALVAHPANALLTTAFVVCLFWHTRLGLHVVAEDYMHVRWQGMTMIILVNLACILGALAAILALGRVVFGT